MGVFAEGFSAGDVSAEPEDAETRRHGDAEKSPARHRSLSPSPFVSTSPRLPQLRVRLTAAAETIVRGGHPWVFAGSIRELNRDGAAGELAVIYDRNDRFLAIGLFDPHSPFGVRILHAG